MRQRSGFSLGPKRRPAQLNFAPLGARLGFLPHRILGMGAQAGPFANPGADAHAGCLTPKTSKSRAPDASDDILEIER